MKLLKKISMLVVTLVAVVCVFGAVSKVNAEGVSYQRVMSTDDLTDGQYLIVCDSKSVAFNASLADLDVANNGVTVTITNNEISGDLSNYEFTIAKNGTKYSILSSSGKYIGYTAGKNGLTSSETALDNDITISSGVASIKAGTAPSTLKYNANSGQTRFRYYKTGQTDVSLYKKVGSSTPEVNPVDTFKALTDAYASKLCFSYEVESETYTVSKMVLRVAIVLDKALYDELIAKSATIGVTVKVEEGTDYTFAASNAVVKGDKVYLVAALDVPTTGYTTEVLFQAFVKVADVKTKMDASLTTTVKDVASKYLTLADDPTVEEHNGVLTYLANLA